MKYEKLGREVLLQEKLRHIKTQYIVNEETINLYIVVICGYRFGYMRASFIQGIMKQKQLEIS